MHFFSVALVAVTIASAQAQSSGNSSADISLLTAGERSSYCNGQINTCGTLCNGANNENTCDTTSLQFTCTCTANNSAPGLQYYTGTMPTFLCELTYSQCIARGENNAAAQRLCTQNREANCGKLDPNDYDPSSASSSSSASKPTASNTESGASSTPTNKDSGAITLLSVNGASAALGLLMVALFGYLL